MTETLLLVGAGGHARACIDVIEQGGRFRILGLVDNDPQLRGQSVLGYPVLGGDADLPALLAECPRALVTVGQIGAPTVRRKLFAALRRLGAALPAVVSPHAVLSRHARLADGVLLGHGAVVQAGATVGSNSIVNSRALIEHDAQVGEHCHVATGALVNGGVVIEEGAFVGSGAILREGIRIGAGAFVGAGSLVAADCPPGSTIKRK